MWLYLGLFFGIWWVHNSVVGTQHKKWLWVYLNNSVSLPYSPEGKDRGSMMPSPTYNWLLIGSVLCRSSTGTLSYCEFWVAVVALWPEDDTLKPLFLSFSFYLLPGPSSWCSSSIKEVAINVFFRSEVANNPYCQHLERQRNSPFISTHHEGCQ